MTPSQSCSTSRRMWSRTRWMRRPQDRSFFLPTWTECGDSVRTQFFTGDKGMSIQPSRAVFAAAVIGLGIIGLIYGNSAEIWEAVPRTLPGRSAIIYLCAGIEVATGIGLLTRSLLILACRVLLPFLLLWTALLKLPAIIQA